MAGEIGEQIVAADRFHRIGGAEHRPAERLAGQSGFLERVERLGNDIEALKGLIDERMSAAQPTQKAMAR